MKNGRWVRVHEQGQANYESTANVMDVTVGSSRCRAEVLYTANTSTIEKAVYWLIRYMGCAKADRLYELTHTKIEEAVATTAKDDERLEISDEKWNCLIEKIEKGKFRVSMDWALEVEPIEFPAKKKRGKKTAEAHSEETATEIKPEEAHSEETAPKKKSTKTNKKVAA